MDYELIWWCVVGIICASILILCAICAKYDSVVSAETLDRINGKSSRNNYIRPFH